MRLLRISRAIGKTEIDDSSHLRSLGWKQYFDPSQGLLRLLKDDGSFFEPVESLMGENFEPSHGFHEGTSWNNSFALPHDLKGLMDAPGSEEAFVKKLETSFTEGYFDVTNEPDMDYPWYFNYIKGKEHLTQKYMDYCLNI